LFGLSRLMQRHTIVYEATVGTDVSDTLLDSCAQLFSTNYGVWGKNAPSYTRAGEQLCMAKPRII
jgi:hypothetical protein